MNHHLHSVPLERLARMLLLLLPGLLWAGSSGLEAATKEFVVAAIDSRERVVTLKSGDDFRSYQLTATAEVTVNGLKATLTDVTPGMKATVVLGSTNTVARLAATGLVKPTTGAGGATKPAGPLKDQTLEVEVPATASKRAPLTVGSIMAGQRVVVTGLRGSWSGGGSKKGVSCDWKGYPDSKVGWMALHVTVGEHEFVFAADTLEFTAPVGGDLRMFAADDDPRGNSGSLTMKVSVGPQPKP